MLKRFSAEASRVQRREACSGRRQESVRGLETRPSGAKGPFCFVTTETQRHRKRRLLHNQNHPSRLSFTIVILSAFFLARRISVFSCQLSAVSSHSSSARCGAFSFSPQRPNHQAHPGVMLKRFSAEASRVQRRSRRAGFGELPATCASALLFRFRTLFAIKQAWLTGKYLLLWAVCELLESRARRGFPETGKEAKVEQPCCGTCNRTLAKEISPQCVRRRFCWS